MVNLALFSESDVLDAYDYALSVMYDVLRYDTIWEDLPDLQFDANCLENGRTIYIRYLVLIGPRQITTEITLLSKISPTVLVPAGKIGTKNAYRQVRIDYREKEREKDMYPKIDWITIEPGPFIMGSDSAQDRDACDNETPQSTCALITEPYRISRYPVTVTQYHVFVEQGGYSHRRFWTTAGWRWRQANQIEEPQTYQPVFQTPNHPQVGVSWYEAVAFCGWLSERVGYTVTLPTEAQWERAARHTDGRIYPWGNQFDMLRCNVQGTGIRATSAVDCFPPQSECGAYDMVGNVWQWCLDDSGDDVDRAVRGGSWLDHQDYVRCASRYWYDPDVRRSYVGFRVVGLLPSLG